MRSGEPIWPATTATSTGTPTTFALEELLAVGDTVSEGSLILLLEEVSADGATPKGPVEEAPAAAPSAPAPTDVPESDVNVQVAVLGAGPGGYTAAFRAADLGLSVALIDRGGRSAEHMRDGGAVTSRSSATT